MLASQPVKAAEPFVNPDWANHAWYAGAGIGATRATIDQASIESALRANGSAIVSFAGDEKDSPAYKVFIGKQLNRYLALEAGYYDLGRFSYDAVTSDGRLGAKAAFSGVNLDLVGQLPLSERLSIIGRVGAAYTRARTDFSGNRLNAVTAPHAKQSKVGPKLGLGMEYKFSEALALRGEYERYRVNDAVGNRGDVDMASVGLVWKFGRPAAAPLAYTPPPVEPVAPVVVVQTQPPVAPQPVSEKVSFAAEALFDFDKSIVKPAGKAALDELLMKLQGMNTEVMVTVGHTDSIGSDAYNQKLSQRRAEAVKAYIVTKGIDSSRVYTEGKGESQAVADNTTEEGRARNRRVTVEVVGTRTR
ncbi:OmpA family protein [Massilia sp. PAMC28688]|nr:OmpA family protein [Massilia sp. PAMC28688]